jgi:polyisoprenoid-binding protein YceI
MTNHVLAPSPGVYAIDAVHNFVRLTAQHRVVGRVRGRLERVAGVTIAEEPIASSPEVIVETASISTPFVARDEGLRSDRFSALTLT